MHILTNNYSEHPHNYHTGQETEHFWYPRHSHVFPPTPPVIESLLNHLYSVTVYLCITTA